jgi:PP-loop superfamily ATP-utilizing enzyme
MEPWARAQGFDALAFGEITDDWSDDRPGARAAREWKVVAPLSQSGFGKDDVRRYARDNALSVAEKPSSACLASRLPVGTRVTREKLARVERCEEGLRALGFVRRRVRDLGSRARVEVGSDELERARVLDADLRTLLAAEGFADFDLAAYGLPFTPGTARNAADSVLP